MWREDRRGDALSEVDVGSAVEFSLRSRQLTRLQALIKGPHDAASMIHFIIMQTTKLSLAPSNRLLLSVCLFGDGAWRGGGLLLVVGAIV